MKDTADQSATFYANSLVRNFGNFTKPDGLVLAHLLPHGEISYVKE